MENFRLSLNNSRSIVESSFVVEEEEETYNIWQCIPLTVTVVPLKPRNFRENGRPEIPEILVYFHSVNGLQKSDSFGKQRNYHNC